MKDLEIYHLSIIAIAFKQLLILTIVILFIAMTKIKNWKFTERNLTKFNKR